MFSFGLFTSLIPYLLLAITSLVGWTTFNWVNKDSFEVDETPKEIQIHEIKTEVEAVYDIFEYLQMEETQLSIDTPNYVFYFNYAITAKSIPTEFFNLSGNNTFRLFNRPPPHICLG